VAATALTGIGTVAGVRCRGGGTVPRLARVKCVCAEGWPVLATVNGSPIHYAEEGGGTPVLALHGVGVDHREIRAGLEAAFADRSEYRRIYPDLPGMGRTPLPATVGSNDDVVDVLLGTRSSGTRRSC
jgi:hypothetical protein